ncbi:unnamed protein product [Heligmosomoides polygyrus]|uniref:Uncharacterized protein n=1 Tax=Heligmosomoides polygyrus TaxID=6339 RepID=A0A3P8DFY0_HELPZ|nr:unnamed protein product [Heligmosomoides polygyrus]
MLFSPQPSPAGYEAVSAHLPGKLDIDGHTWNFDRSLRNDARLAASKDSSGENLQLFTRRHPKRWSTPWVNTLSKHRRHAPERRSSIPRSVEEPFHLEGGLHSRELVEDMISRMRKQSQEIIASHFPLFPNRFMDSISMGPPPFRFLNHNTSWKPSSPEQLVIPW